VAMGKRHSRTEGHRARDNGFQRRGGGGPCPRKDAGRIVPLKRRRPSHAETDLPLGLPQRLR
jgi:hypothetical protein